MGLLARREHSAQELFHKLRAREYDESAIQTAIDSLIKDGLQSDERFAEQFIRSRTERGYGPVRIRLELRERGIDDAIISHSLDMNDPVWKERARVVREKRFGHKVPDAYSERARQARFLQQRGYAFDQIRQLIYAGDD